MQEFTELLKLNLQNFSDKETEIDPEETEVEKDDKSGKVEFDEEQQAHINKLIRDAKSKAKNEFEKQIDDKVQDILKKEKDYAQLSEKEREIKKFEDEREQFMKERADYEYEKLKMAVSKDLIEKGLPPEFAEYLTVRDDNEKSLDNVSVFEKKFNDAVSEEVKMKLKQPGVRDGAGSGTKVSLGAELAKEFTPSSKIFE